MLHQTTAPPISSPFHRQSLHRHERLFIKAACGVLSLMQQPLSHPPLSISPLRSLSPPLHRRLEWRVRKWDFFVAASKSRSEIWFVCDVTETSEGHLGYSGNQSQLICHWFSPGWPHSFEIQHGKTALFSAPLLLFYAGDRINQNVEGKEGTGEMLTLLTHTKVTIKPNKLNLKMKGTAGKRAEPWSDG